MNALAATDFQFPGQKGKYTGKVRDVYDLGDRLVLIATDRISAFDVILPHPIPYKGQVLNQIAAKFLQATSAIVPNWLETVPHPNASMGKKADPFPVEIVVRNYLTGHAWREYKAGKRTLCGQSLPDGLKEHDPLPAPIITPTTKAHKGHDEDISRDEILKKKLLTADQWRRISTYAMALFEWGTRFAKGQGLILVDTKYEFGEFENEIILIDEVHTPDSSRYFYAGTYEELQAAGAPQKQLSKEFVREWLMDHGFQGKPREQIPEMNPEMIQEISNRYIELYEHITGEKFEKAPYNDKLAELNTAITLAIEA